MQRSCITFTKFLAQILMTYNTTFAPIVNMIVWSRTIGLGSAPKLEKVFSFLRADCPTAIFNIQYNLPVTSHSRFSIWTNIQTPPELASIPVWWWSFSSLFFTPKEEQSILDTSIQHPLCSIHGTGGSPSPGIKCSF